jgi:hypothetical protein
MGLDPAGFGSQGRGPGWQGAQQRALARSHVGPPGPWPPGRQGLAAVGRELAAQVEVGWQGPDGLVGEIGGLLDMAGPASPARPQQRGQIDPVTVGMED